MAVLIVGDAGLCPLSFIKEMNADINKRPTRAIRVPMLIGTVAQVLDANFIIT